MSRCRRGCRSCRIVIRNSGELMWRGASTIPRAGSVQVAVLPPVPTLGWTAGELDRHVHEVRNQYLETLADWPGRGSGPVTATEPRVPGPPPAVPLDWGTAPEMNPLETAMWRAEEADNRLRVNVSLLELLDPVPGWDRLLAAHEWASRMVPRMRSGWPSRVRAGHADLGDRQPLRPVPACPPVKLPAPGSLRQLLDVVQDFAAAPFDRQRPLWEALLVEGLAGGRAGYLVKSHHSVTDGLGAVQLITRLHSRSPEHDPQRPEPLVPGRSKRRGSGCLPGRSWAPPGLRQLSRCARASIRSAR